MSDKLEKAINNNHGLYQAIFNQYNIDLHIKDGMAYTENKVPPIVQHRIIF